MVITVAPSLNPRPSVADIRLRFRVKEPERYVNSLDFFDVILILKDLRQQALSLVMFRQSRLSGLCVHLKRNHKIRLQKSGELLRHHHRTVAVRTSGSRRIRIRNDFSAAGVADIRTETVSLPLLPPAACLRLPCQILGSFIFQFAVIGNQRLDVELRITIGTFHFLYRAVETDRSAAAWALEFLEVLPFAPLLFSYLFHLPGVIFIKGISALRAELRRLCRIFRFPAALIAAVQQRLRRLFCTAFRTEFAFIFRTAAADPAPSVSQVPGVLRRRTPDRTYCRSPRRSQQVQTSPRL